MKYIVIRRIGYDSNMVLPSTEVIYETDEWELAMKKISEQEKAWFRTKDPEAPMNITFSLYESV